MLHERQAIGQPGQIIMVRQIVDARLRFHAVADVAHDGHALQLTIEHHAAHDELDRNMGATLVQQHAFIAGLFECAQDLSDLGRRLGRNEVPDLMPQHFAHRIANQLAQRRIDVRDHAVAMKHNPFQAGVHELGEPLCRFLCGALGKPVFGDVGDLHECSGDLAGIVELWQQVHLDPPLALAAFARHLAFVNYGTALTQHLVHKGLDLLRGLGADHLGKGMPQQRGLGPAESLRIVPIREQASHIVRVVQCDQHRQTVGQHMKLRKLLACFILLSSRPLRIFH